MATWCDIRYGHFWDQPRVFYALSNERSLFFECLFDEELDDYPSTYDVYSVPNIDVKDLSKHWHDPQRGSLVFVGTARIAQKSFDSTYRKQIDLDAVEFLLAATPASDGA